MKVMLVIENGSNKDLEGVKNCGVLPMEEPHGRACLKAELEYHHGGKATYLYLRGVLTYD